jgi:hypothetical protein
MYFAHPWWGLAALAAVPAIIVIHLFHRRFPPLVVAGLHLWTPETRHNLAGRRVEKLPVSLSLILETLAGLLLALALGEPHFGGLSEAVHLVAVLDNSASMSAKVPGRDGVSFRDAAVAELERRAEGLPRGSVVTIILSGTRPVMLAGPAVAWTDAKPRLSAWQPHAPRHSFEPAWDLGLQLIEKSGELLFVTDHLPPEKETPEKMTCVSVGRKLENVAVSAARWTFDSAAAKGQVYVRLQNHSRKTMRFDLAGRSGESVVFRRSGTLAEQGAQAVEADVPGGLRQLTVELASPDDGLAIDNRVELVEPQVRTVTAAIEIPQADAARAILRVLDALPDVQLSEVPESNLLFAPAGTLPESNPRRWWAGIGPISTDEADVKGAKDILGPYLLDKRQPLLEGVVLGGVVWGGVQPLKFDVTPLVSSGNRALLSRLNGTRTVGYLFNIDLSRSNLAESPDWPILLTNLVEMRRESLPGLARWNYRLGEDVRFRLFEGEGEASAAGGELTLVHNGKTKKTVAKTSVVELPALEETGVYEVKDGDSLVGRFAINLFDAEESDLRNLVPGRRAAKTETSTGIIALDNPYSWFILAAVLLILIAVFSDWFVLKRR